MSIDSNPSVKPSISIIGCGWLGISLAEDLIADGFQVRGSTTQEDKIPLLRQKGIEAFLFRLSDPLDREGVKKIFDSHIIILNIPPGRNKPEQQKIYAQTMKELAEKALHSPIIRNVLFISSTAVYRGMDGEVGEKTTFTKSGGPYVDMLREVERTFQGEHNTILRLGGLIGGQRHPIVQLSGKQDLKGGNLPVNLIHRDDVIGLIKAIVEQKAWGETFLGVAHNKPRKEDYYPEVARKLSLDPPTYSPLAYQADFPLMNNQATRQKLDYSFKRDDPFLMIPKL